MVLPVAAVVVVLPVALAQEEVLQGVLLQVVPHHLDLILARLRVHQDRHLDVLALLVDGLLDGAPGAQVEVALPVHCLDVVSVPIGIRQVLRYVQCGLVVVEESCCIQGRSTPVQNLLEVRLPAATELCPAIGDI